MTRQRLVMVLALLVAACTRDAQVSAIYTNVKNDGELFPCDPSREMWRVSDSSLSATYAKLGGVRLYVRLIGTKLDSGSIYGSRHRLNVRQVLEARAAKPDECRPQSSMPTFATPVPPGEPVPADVATSLLGFTQRFYDWYLPLLMNGQIANDWERTLRPRVASIDPDLLRALKEDGDASARDPNEVVGLDFDPFVASQDPCQAYKVGAATKHGEQYWVQVFGVCDGKQHDDPDLIAQVERRQDAWVIVNLRYPDGDDLVQTLKKLKADRATSDKH